MRTTPICIGAAVIACSLSAFAQDQDEQRILANTSYVEDMLVVPSKGNHSLLYVATRGGVEAYELPSGDRIAHYTTLDGLDTLHVRALSRDGDTLIAHLAEARCALSKASRFRCEPARRQRNVEPSVAGRLGGARITKRTRYQGTTLVATAGAGVWIVGKAPRRLTPASQICSNHHMAIARFRGRTYFGSFDEGLCFSKDDRNFTKVKGPFRMINDLQATPKGLYVAAAEGLFLTTDGTQFRKVPHVTQRGVNGLAFDGRSLWVTTPGALWRVRVQGGPRDREYWTPGGSRSLQAVAARGRDVWIATEDRGLLKKTRGGFRIFDRAAGMPSSWLLDVAIGHDGTTYGATLRHGIVAIHRNGAMERVESPHGPWTLFVDADGGRLAIGGQGGASLLRGSRRRDFSLPHPNAHVIRRIGRSTYIATEGGTLLARQGRASHAP